MVQANFLFLTLGARDIHPGEVGSGEIWLNDVQCVGNEVRLINCPSAELGGRSCTHFEDAGVSCETTGKYLIVFSMPKNDQLVDSQGCTEDPIGEVTVTSGRHDSNTANITVQTTPNLELGSLGYFELSLYNSSLGDQVCKI